MAFEILGPKSMGVELSTKSWMLCIEWFQPLELDQ